MDAMTFNHMGKLVKALYPEQDVEREFLKLLAEEMQRPEVKFEDGVRHESAAPISRERFSIEFSRHRRECGRVMLRAEFRYPEPLRYTAPVDA
jgi:hypothetical protein